MAELGRVGAKVTWRIVFRWWEGIGVVFTEILSVLNLELRALYNILEGETVGGSRSSMR